MYRNPLWIFFLSLVIAGILGYTGYTLVKIWQYRRLDQQTTAQKVQWNILSLSEEAFVPIASYSYIVQGQTYQGRTRWEETYLNQWAAQEAIERLEHSPPPIWYASSSPEISSLQKFFPFKQSVYAFLLCILGVYFIGLGYYVNRRF